MSVKIEDFIGKKGNATLDLMAYSQAKSGELSAIKGTTVKYIPTDDENKKVNNHWFPNSSNKPNTGGGSKLSNAAGDVTSKIRDYFASGEATEFPNIDKEFVMVKDMFGVILDGNGKLKSGGDILKGIYDAAAAGVNTYREQQAALLGLLNKGVGLTGDLSRQFREELTEANIELTQYGIGFSEIANSAKKILEDSGRFLLYNRSSFYEFGVTAQAYVGGLEKLAAMLPEFEKIGMGGITASRAIRDAGQKSLELGLNSQKVTETLSKDLGKLNEYGFQNGIKGLSEMTRKSIEFRTNMSETFKIAEKVMDPQGAIEFASKLQVLGGAIGDLGDPLKLMYMSTNNVEGLQEALLKAAGNLATYNAEQGKFEINSLNIRRAHDMAKELGFDYKELTNSAIAFQERAMAKTQLGGIEGLGDEQVRFLTNLSRMENGKMVIDVQGTTLQKNLQGIIGSNTSISLDEIASNDNLRNAILKNQDQFKQLSPEKIINEQATNVQQITRMMTYMVARMRQQGATGVENFLAKSLGIDTDLKNTIVDALKSGESKVKGVSESISNFAKQLGIPIKDLTNSITNSPKSGTPQKTLNDKMKDETLSKMYNTTTPTTPTESNLNVRISADSIMDGWTREMVKDSSITDSLLSLNMRSYTTNPIKNK